MLADVRRLPALLVSVLALGACKKGERADDDASADRKPTAADEDNAEAEAPPAPAEVKAAPIPELALTVADAVDPERYAEQLRFVAAERPPGSPHWQAVQDRCAEVFEAAGFEVERFAAEGAGINVVGRRPGKDSELAPVVVGAHYDHIEGCVGADDNASGVAAVLELAEVLGGERSWSRSLVLACWDREETGLEGSTIWLDEELAAGREPALYINFDAVAYADATPKSQRLPPGIDLLFAEQYRMLEEREFRADFIAVLADAGAHEPASRARVHAERLELPAAVLEVPAMLKNEAALADLRRSDHAPFWGHDIPAIFFSDTAEFRTDTYHCTGRPDTVETLDLAFAVKVVRVAAGLVAEQLSK